MTLVLRIPKGDKLTKAEMDNNLTYLEGLSQSKLGTGSFNAFTSSYTTGSFTGSFKGDGSGLTGIPSGTSISTGSFATTGSNVFIGGQIITGSFTARSGSGFLTSSVKFIHNTISPSQGSSTFEVRHINSEYSENFAVKLFADDFIAKMQYEKDGSTFDMLRTNLAGDLHLTQNTRLFGTDLRIDGTLKLTGSLSSAASANFLGNVTASVFTGSFVGDGSGLTGISGVTPIATGSFATTGSNSFVGTETITGALRITGSLNLRSPSYPTSGSLVRIDDTRTHIFVRPSGSNTSGNIQLYDSGDSRSILIINASQTSIGQDATSNAYGNNNAQNFIRGNTQFFQNITSSANIQAVSFIGDGSGLTNIPGVTPPFEEIEYQALYSLVQSASLYPGKHYLISDYQTCYDQPNWTANGSAITVGNYKSGSVEPLVVLAISSASLAPHAHSTLYPKDIIKYDISWNTTEVTSGDAKGRIYERVDERGNRTDYDWRAVQFKRYDSHHCENIRIGRISIQVGGGSGSAIGVGTNFDNDFSVGDVLGVYNQDNGRIGGFDFYEVISVSGSSYLGVTGSYYNTVSNTYYSNPGTFSGGSPFQNNLVSVDKSEYEYYTFEDMSNSWYNNYIGDYLGTDTFILSNNVFRDGDYRDNHFGPNVVGNTFDDDCYGNHCGMEFQYNIIANDWDNNSIGDRFNNNIIECDMQENIIGNDFEYNMIGDDEGIEFSYNIINADSFRRNWFTGNENFDSNIISDNFDNNIINSRFGNNLATGQLSNNYLNGGVFRNQFKGTFTNNKIYNDFANNIFQGFYNNTALNEVLRNQFNGYASDNILSGSFNDNIVGDSFQNNTFLGYTANNQIGTYFEDNTIGDSFGYGAGYSRANKIGHYFQDNNIGEYFYSNTISDNFNGNTVGNYFQQNTVFANNININDFTSLYGNIVSYSIVNPNVSGSDGVYPLIETTTNGQGIDVTFDVTITSGSASVVIANVGKLYSTEDTLTITGSLIGGGTNLEINVDTVSPTPAVYQYLDSTIVRNYEGDLKLTYLGTSGLGIVGINEPVD